MATRRHTRVADRLDCRFARLDRLDSFHSAPRDAPHAWNVKSNNGYSLQNIRTIVNFIVPVLLLQIGRPERRLSNSSDGSACSGYSKATTDSADFLATRAHTAAVIPGKPAANPLQFVRVGPADLGSRAREQLRRAELAKRTEPARIEIQEDWQS
ncbi:hypothetical protein evm_002006, partial [Chilo suppressalis]